MTTRVLSLLAVCGAVLLGATSALAHHFVPRASDTPMIITGTVVAFDMRNPHSRLVVDVVNAAGEVERWNIELGSVHALAARGWTRDVLKPGDPVSVEAILWAGRSEAAVARSVGLPDGRTVFAGSHAGDRARR